MVSPTFFALVLLVVLLDLANRLMRRQLSRSDLAIRLLAIASGGFLLGSLCTDPQATDPDLDRGSPKSPA
jgi:hypothetical protein